MEEEQIAVISINQDYCSRCSICYSICPYDAIKRDIETGKVEIDLQKCQLCGICYSACPVFAIEIIYYDYNSLVKYVDEARKKVGTETIVLMCRGGSSSFYDVEEILAENDLKIKDNITIRIPCAGRVPTEFIFRVLGLGIKNIISIQCEDSFCRFKEGTKINFRRLILARKALEQLGFNKEAIRVIKHSNKVIYDTAKCVGCDKCVFVCPYYALEAEPFATPKIIYENCKGCGACAVVCPHQAIEVKGFKFEDVLKRYFEFANKLKPKDEYPLILVFCCQWSEFSALDISESIFHNKHTVVFEVPCFNALDPVHVVNALRSGFDGVMAIVCPDQDCKLQEGRDLAEKNMNALRDVLRKLNMLDCFELFYASPREADRFEKILSDFLERIIISRKRTYGGK